jgi:hypothetical protein
VHEQVKQRPHYLLKEQQLCAAPPAAGSDSNAEPSMGRKAA